MILIYLYGALAWAFIWFMIINHHIKEKTVTGEHLFVFFYFTSISWVAVLVFLWFFIFFYLKENIDLNKKIF